MRATSFTKTKFNIRFDRVYSSNKSKRKWYFAEMPGDHSFIDNEDKLTARRDNIDKFIDFFEHILEISMMVTIDTLSVPIPTRVIESSQFSYFLDQKKSHDFSKICLELTNSFDEDKINKNCIKQLKRLKEQGCQISLKSYDCNSWLSLPTLFKLHLIDYLNVSVHILTHSRTYQLLIDKLVTYLSKNKIEIIAKEIHTPVDFVTAMNHKFKYLQGEFIKKL